MWAQARQQKYSECGWNRIWPFASNSNLINNHIQFACLYYHYIFLNKKSLFVFHVSQSFALIWTRYLIKVFRWRAYLLSYNYRVCPTMHAGFVTVKSILKFFNHKLKTIQLRVISKSTSCETPQSSRMLVVSCDGEEPPVFCPPPVAPSLHLSL